jgi:hypothetical protein
VMKDSIRIITPPSKDKTEILPGLHHFFYEAAKK